MAQAHLSRCISGLAVFLLTAIASPAQSDSPVEVHPTLAHLENGADISVELQRAIDTVRSRGGRIVLPTGAYTLSQTVDLAGTLRKFPSGAPNGITLDGNGAVLTWTGPDEGAVLDLPGIAGCAIRNLTIRGEVSRTWENIAGLRYRGGLERRNNGGKNNSFESLQLENLGIGIETGGLFGPDLVGGTFLNIAVRKVRIGYRFMGPNVTSMLLFNPVIEGYREAGIAILAFPGRQVRANAEEPLQNTPSASNPGVLMDADQQREVFQSDLPAWLSDPSVTYPTNWVTLPDGTRRLQAGGGGLDVTVFGLRAFSENAAAWAVDTNWGNIRVYSGYVSGPGGVFRSKTATTFGHYTTLLKDVIAPEASGPEGNSVEMHGKGPLYLTGGYYGGRLALGRETEVYQFGARFEGVRSIKGTAKAILYGPGAALRSTLLPQVGTTELIVKNAGGSCSFLPNFNAGGIWQERQPSGNLRLRWLHPAPKGAAIDAVAESPAPFLTVTPPDPS